MKKIVLMQRVRVMEKFTKGPQLSRTNNYIEAGTKIEVGEPETCAYHHRDQPARPVVWKGETYYILEEELNSGTDVLIHEAGEQY